MPISRGEYNAPEWNEDDWDLLLSHIRAGDVIPVLGKDLLQMSIAGEELRFYDYLPNRLMNEYRAVTAASERNPFTAETERTPADRSFLRNATMNEVVVEYSKGMQPQVLLRKIQRILEEVGQEKVPKTLAQLAEITDFNFFVTTTFDPLLQRAIEQQKVGRAQRRPKVLAYNPSPSTNCSMGDIPPPPVDRPDDRWSCVEPLIYHLLGRVEPDTRRFPSSNVVLDDEDLADFICALNSENKAREPVNLLNEFSRKNLLLLGCSFSDWLARFFLRATKRRRRYRHQGGDPRSMRVEYVVDDCSLQDQNLVVFVEQFPFPSRIYRTGNVIKFVEELNQKWRRWRERHGDSAEGGVGEAIEVTAHGGPMDTEAGEVGGGIASGVLGRDRWSQESPNLPMSKEFVFVSYSRDDARAVEQFCAGLKSHCITVWFDRESLGGGVEFGDEIEQAIRTCKIFIPIISKNTNSREESYFYREWHAAVDRAHAFRKGARFIWPVTIDETELATANVPKKFLETHGTVLKGGQVSEAFAQQLLGCLERQSLEHSLR